MDLTFLQLKQKVAELTQHTGVTTAGVITYPDKAFLTRAGTWLQLSEKLLSELYDFWIELQDIHNFSSVSGTEAYDMPSNFDKPFRVYDLTNKKEIPAETEETYSDRNIGNIADATTGTPSVYRIYGVSNRLKQMKLGLIPDATISYRILFKKIIDGMIEDTDKAFTNADRYLTWDAAGNAYKWEREDEKAQVAWGKAGEALQVLVSNQMNNLGVEFQERMVSQWLQSHRV